MVGTTGKYRLDARLGGGGMAEVFLASTIGAEGFSRKVAIKRVLPGFSENPAFAQMFISEAQISSRLQHPNIVSVLDFDRDAEQHLFLVMELVDGKDLDTLSSTGPLPIPVVIYVIAEALRGLGHAHDLPVGDDGMRGIVHRDVSPHNVLLSWDGAVKVSDFGIAKARSASSATASVFIKGKPAYMSPEQANGENLDGRSDLFAVGVMLWELLCGRRLFVGEDTRSTLAAVLFGQIPRPRSVRGDVPKDLERVVMKLLERDLPARYTTAEDAVRDLLACEVAPKDGRDVLSRTLAERFPQQAPVRNSVLRQRERSAPIAAPHVSLPPDSATIAHGMAGRGTPQTPIPSMSVGEGRHAVTHTAGPAARIGRGGGGKKGLWIGLGAVAVIGIVATVAVVASGGSGSGSGAVAGSGSGSGSVAVAATGSAAAAAADAATATATVADAATAVAQITPDAASPSPPPKKDATPPGPQKIGRLAVHAFPALTVYVDRKKIHDTPVEIPLGVGKHTLRLVNAETNHDESVPITITENHTTTIER